MMRKLRITAIVLAVIAAALLCWYVVTNKVMKDRTGPVISMDSGVIETTVADAGDTLLQGVTARDASDGDVTDSILVESISAFTGDKHRVVTYAAFDSDNHVAHATRELIYTDYHSPRFSMANPLSFAVGSDNILSGVTAQDMLDGDITSEIRLTADREINTAHSGTYPARLRVSNSAGDISSIPVTIEFYDSSKLRQPQISLTDYCIYIKKGADFDPLKYLDYVEINGREYSFTDGSDDTYHIEDGYRDTDSAEDPTFGRDFVEIDSDVDTERAGVYTVVFSVTAGTGNNEETGTVRMYVNVADDSQEAAQ